MNEITCAFVQMPYNVGIADITIYTVVSIFSVVLAFLGTMANVLVITAYWHNRRLQTLQNFLLVVFAMADLPVTACLQPMLVISVFVRNNCVFWDVYYIFSFLFIDLSLVTTVLLTLQTFVTLACPYRQKMLTKVSCRVFLDTCHNVDGYCSYNKEWLIYLARAYVYCTSNSFYRSINMAVDMSDCLVLRHQNAIHSKHTPTRIMKGRKSLRSTLTVFIIISSLLVCYTLSLTFMMFAKSRLLTDDRIPASLWSISALLMHTNSFLNPCLVFWRCSAFRQTVNSML